jgi:hypothetical protein
MGFGPGSEISNMYYAIGIAQTAMVATNAYISVLNSGLGSSSSAYPVNN